MKNIGKLGIAAMLVAPAAAGYGQFVNLQTQVHSTLPPVNGGTGEAGTFTGLRKANGAGADTQAQNGDVFPFLESLIQAGTGISISNTGGVVTITNTGNGSSSNATTTTFETNGATNGSQTTYNLQAGSNITLTNSGGTTTINSTATSGNGTSATFETNGTQNTTQTLLNLVSGTGISLSASGGVVTITNTSSGSGSGAVSVYPSVVTYGADPTGNNDSATAIKNALAANPYGIIFFPTQTNGSQGIYKVGSQITESLTQSMLGEGSNSIVINCTMTSGPCLVRAGTTANVTFSSRNQGFNLNGSGSGNSTMGEFLGGDPNGTYAPSGDYGNETIDDDVEVTNFGSGIYFGNNAYVNNFINGEACGNAIGVNIPQVQYQKNTGEKETFVNYGICNGGQPFNIWAGELMMDGYSQDYNGSPAQINQAYLYVTNSHFEQTSGAFLTSNNGYPGVEILNSNMLLAGGSGTDTAFIDLSGGPGAEIVLDGINAYSNHTVNELVNLNTNIHGHIADLASGYDITQVANGAGTNIMVDGWQSLPTIYYTGGTANAQQNSLNLAAGSNVTLSQSGNTVTIAASGSGGSTTATPYTITSGATPAINPANGTIQLLTLSANAVPTLGTITAGQKMTLRICQGSSTVYTYTQPAGLHGAIPGSTIGGMAANTCAVQSFTAFTTSDMNADGPGVIGQAP